MGSSATHTFIGERRWRHRSRPFNGLLPLPLLHEKCPAAAQRHGCRSPRAAPELSDEGVGQFPVINAPSQWLCSTCNVKIKPVHKLAVAPRQEDCRSEERQQTRCPPPHHQPRCERCDQKTLSSRSTRARLRLRPSRGLLAMSSMSSNASALVSAHSTSVLGAVASGITSVRTNRCSQ